MGAMNSNIFVAGRLTVAAANKRYIPAFFGYTGRIRSQPQVIDESAAKELKFDAPFNALILSTILTSLYILVGNFRALLTFIGLGQCEFLMSKTYCMIILMHTHRYFFLPHNIRRCHLAFPRTQSKETFQAADHHSSPIQHCVRSRSH
jgi:L-type amino acid transporter 9